MIFLHPFGTSLVAAWRITISNTIGHPLDSALCVGQLVRWLLERFPKLKICNRPWRRLPAGLLGTLRSRLDPSRGLPRYLKKPPSNI